LWGAVGDALGRPAAGRDQTSRRARYGPAGPREYVPWHGWWAGSAGTFTDDTQLTRAVARSVIAMGGQLDPANLTSHRVSLRPHIWGHRSRHGGRERRAPLALRGSRSWGASGFGGALEDSVLAETRDVAVRLT
jgi:ADP-ribosylglycohydrolase